ncbi:MAG: biopolymer transporter ExbD [Rhodocyclaceae bacterium]|jgi:biopolymer transport protein ExbD|nr:biopolymer transporter ExbD [Rhodocyclaceae bacterium]
MNFQRGRQRAEPEVNLIPLIDVVLVIIIFLMLTTTFSRIATLEINLPEGQAEEAQATADEIAVAITAAGEIIVNGVLVGSRDVTAIAETVGKAIPPGNPDPVVVINADAKAEHQSVIDVMQAAQRVGLSHITFSIQMPEQ